MCPRRVFVVESYTQTTLSRWNEKTRKTLVRERYTLRTYEQ